MKPFGETNRMVGRPCCDLWVLPETMQVYILPPAVSDSFLLEYIPV